MLTEKLFVDTNVLFSFFWKTSWIRDIILQTDVLLYSPEKTLEELDRHAPDIRSKAKIDEGTYQIWKNVLKWNIIEVQFEAFKEKLPEASQIAPDEKDTELFAVALLQTFQSGRMKKL